MTWLIPVHKNNGIHFCYGDVSPCRYVRSDKVCELISFIVNKSYHHETIESIYQITEKQFHDIDIFNPEVLKANGKKVY